MIEINNLTKVAIEKNFFKRVAKIVLKGENVDKAKELSIVLVNKSKIKELNNKYRKKNQSTDVLSFRGNDDSTELGEIVICPEEVKKNAKAVDSIFKKELTFVLIHGILHLLGYDHKKTKKEAEEMRKKEKYYLSQI